MTGVLAPRNVGYKGQQIQVKWQWWPVGSPSRVNWTDSPTILSHFKSATVKSNFKVPTDYSRCISKIVPGGHWKATNGHYNCEGQTAGQFAVIANPLGCDITAGKVTVPSWMFDAVVQSAIIETNQLSNNILEDLGQLKSTGVLIAELFNVIVQLYISCSLGNFKYARRALRALGSNVPRKIANGWLMYFYGIRPLMSTIEALSASESPLYKTLKVSKRQTTSTDPSSYVAGGKTAYRTFSGKATMSAQCQIVTRIRMSGNLRTFADLGISENLVTDLVVTGWALVPYSFVLDWVLPVERWLRALTWSAALEFQHAFVGSRHHAISGIREAAPLAGAGPYPYGGKLPTAILQVLLYQRKKYLNVPPPSGLNFKLSLNSNQIVSAAALIASRKL